MKRVAQLTQLDGRPCVRLFLMGYHYHEDVPNEDLLAWPTGCLSAYHADQRRLRGDTPYLNDARERLHPDCRVFDNDEDAMLCYLSLS